MLSPESLSRTIASILVAMTLMAGPSALGAQAANRGISVIAKPGPIKTLPGNAGKRYALCIGINNYSEPGMKLALASADARSLSEVFAKQGQFDRVDLMTTDVDPLNDTVLAYPKLGNVRRRMEALEKIIKPEDMVVLTFAGHGITDDEGDGYLVMSDSDSGNAASLYASCLPVNDVLAWMSRLKVKKSLLILDACRNNPAKSRSLSVESTGLKIPRFQTAEVQAVFYGTMNGYLSYEDPESGHGMFTRYLLEGLQGKADYQSAGNRDGIVTFRELATFVEEGVWAATQASEQKQRPYSRILGESFGDLAIATYGATIDEGTRSLAGSAPREKGFGALSILSNEDGEVILDLQPMGSLAAGIALELEEIPSGAHYLEIIHAQGTSRRELRITPNQKEEVLDVVISYAQATRQYGGVSFALVRGNTDMPDFWMAQTEITMEQYRRFTLATGYRSQGNWEQYYTPVREQFPVLNLTWYDCQEYLKWFNAKYRLKASLPTAAQWQWASGGRSGTSFPWGNQWNPDLCQNSGGTATAMLPVLGSRGPVQALDARLDISLDGIYNLAGNLREWAAPLPENEAANPATAPTVGGSWNLSAAKYFERSSSVMAAKKTGSTDLGFRIVLAGD